MSVKLINLTVIKQHLNVLHDFKDQQIESLLVQSVEVAEKYLNKKIFDTAENLALAVTEGDIESEARGVIISETINAAIALLVEWRYYGVSARGADKIEDAALNMLHPDRFIVGW